jgi:hypothetical protein
MEKALAKALDSKSEAKEAKEASEVNNDSMKTGFLEDLEKAKQAQSTAKGAMTAAAGKMFMFYSNLLSPESKYSWNKILGKQMESDLYVNLQVYSLEGPSRMSCESFTDCIMFHLLTHFPSTRLSKKSTTSQMYLRSPSASTYASSYGK